MAIRQRYPCPVCGTFLSKEKFLAASRATKKVEAHIEHLEQELKRSQQQSKIREREAAEHARQAARKRNQQEVHRLKKTNEKLYETIRHLREGKTAQEIGLADEHQLFKALQRHFPGDQIIHTGKNGDVLHEVRFEKRIVGRIVYECKHYSDIPRSHIRQAYQAMETHRADEAVLVTTGKRRWYDGFGTIQGVRVVGPYGVIPLVEVLRHGLLELAKERHSRKQRAILARRLNNYLNSQEFKGPLRDVIERTRELGRLWVEELKEHRSKWQERLKHYQWVHWDAGTIHFAVDRVFHGAEPASLPPPRKVSLPLLEEGCLPLSLGIKATG
ncbi:MAG: DUF2130 domain-containing protein [Candidatus Omnitrophica bacterium]|nr:DUF2130 domain-containing protein [Candidatus Omnitrophota bacterium]